MYNINSKLYNVLGKPCFAFYITDKRPLLSPDSAFLATHCPALKGTVTQKKCYFFLLSKMVFLVLKTRN